MIPIHQRFDLISDLAPAVQLRGPSTYVHETVANANVSLDTIAKRVARIEKNLGLEPLE